MNNFETYLTLKIKNKNLENENKKLKSEIKKIKLDDNILDKSFECYELIGVYSNKKLIFKLYSNIRQYIIEHGDFVTSPFDTKEDAIKYINTFK